MLIRKVGDTIHFVHFRRIVILKMLTDFAAMKWSEVQHNESKIRQVKKFLIQHKKKKI